MDLELLAWILVILLVLVIGLMLIILHKLKKPIRNLKGYHQWETQKHGALLAERYRGSVK